MTQKYRTDDLTKWGTGIGRRLTPAEVDNNFWDALARILALESAPSAGAGIDHFSITGQQLYVTLTDATVLGPYLLPVATFNDRGTWQPATVYGVLDTFTINGGLYEVIFAHTSAASFDAGANDGSGHDYYHLLVQTPGSSLPTGGATSQVLKKSSSTDFAVAWSWSLTTTGKVAGKFLQSTSSSPDASAWVTPDAAEISFTPPTGSLILSHNVSDALEEIRDALTGTRLSELFDVLFATGDPLPGALLTYDGAEWTATAPISTGEFLQWNGSNYVGGAGTGVTTLAALTDVLFATGDPQTGALLWYDGAHWTAVPPLSTDDFLKWDGTQFVGATPPVANVPVQTISSSGATSVDLSLGEAIELTMTGNVALTFTNVLAAGSFNRVVIEVHNTGAFNITAWPSGTTFPGGSSPTITSGSGKVDIVSLVSFDGGSTWRGALVGQDFH